MDICVGNKACGSPALHGDPGPIYTVATTESVTVPVEARRFISASMTTTTFGS
jgi:hypothetical protein